MAIAIMATGIQARWESRRPASAEIDDEDAAGGEEIMREPPARTSEEGEENYWHRSNRQQALARASGSQAAEQPALLQSPTDRLRKTSATTGCKCRTSPPSYVVLEDMFKKVILPRINEFGALWQAVGQYFTELHAEQQQTQN